MARPGLDSRAMGTIAAGPGLPVPDAVPLCFPVFLNYLLADCAIGEPIEYQADERASIARLSWRVSGR